MKGVQFYELFGGLAHKNHAVLSFHIIIAIRFISNCQYNVDPQKMIK